MSGAYRDYVSMMLEQHNRKDRPLTENIIVIDSYDGAEHKISNSGRTNVISFSSKTLSNNTITSGVTSGKSQDILTWQQLNCGKKAVNIYPALADVYKEKSKFSKRL